MGGKLSKKGFSVAYEKPTAQSSDEEATEAATVKPEETHPAAESVGLTTEKRDQDSQVPAHETEDKEGSGVPAVGVEEICKPEPKQLDLVPNEEQQVTAISEETIKSPKADPSQLLEVTEPTGVENRQEGDGEYMESPSI
ncbi:unnamed protein product [Lepidochelys olivacea]